MDERRGVESSALDPSAHTWLQAAPTASRLTPAVHSVTCSVLPAGRQPSYLRVIFAAAAPVAAPAAAPITVPLVSLPITWPRIAPAIAPPITFFVSLERDDVELFSSPSALAVA